MAPCWLSTKRPLRTRDETSGLCGGMVRRRRRGAPGCSRGPRAVAAPRGSGTREHDPLLDGLPSLLSDSALRRGLVALAAMLAGVVPALWATGRWRQSGLHAQGATTGLQLGKTWTALVVAQVALSTAVLPVVGEFTWLDRRSKILGSGIDFDEFLTANLTMRGETRPGTEADPREFASRFGAFQTELVRQLAVGPGVSGATVSRTGPGNNMRATIEVDEVNGVGPEPFTASLQSGRCILLRHLRLQAPDRSKQYEARFRGLNRVFLSPFAQDRIFTEKRGSWAPSPDPDPHLVLSTDRTAVQQSAGGQPVRPCPQACLNVQLAPCHAISIYLEGRPGARSASV